MSANEQPVIEWNRVKLAKLKRKHAEADKRGDTEFTFEGHVLLVAYAKYLIEYLESRPELK